MTIGFLRWPALEDHRRDAADQRREIVHVRTSMIFSHVRRTVVLPLEGVSP
ncbi:hypothetical protein [Nocardia sp. MDA0666]|uniref:hypothetical protein n=1 Tax=Nocardia sp. MDA0666 TaxID=2135448 RepID=UPI001304D091|nr:hypothetical protein [Nocardia sp. MDA0666]